MTNVQPLRTFAAPVSRDQLALLVLAYVERGDIEDAAHAASMSVREALAALRTSGVRAMMARAMRHQLDVVAAPAALAELVRQLASKSEKVRHGAARSLLDRAGVVAQPTDAARDRSLSELSADDLRALIDQLQQEASERTDAPQLRATTDASDWLA